MLLLESLYLLSTAMLAIYGLNTLYHTWVYWQFRKQDILQTPKPFTVLETIRVTPTVTVQLPIYNERHVARRLIDAVANLDWPAQHLHIQVLDDSTDDTCQIVAGTIARYQDKGLTIDHIRRPNRQGYKAGALQQGLATTQGEFIAIFDADFIPLSDFLQKAIPCFADSTVGCVQTRWGHVNPDVSGLTKAQALGIDGHFIVEQQARHQMGAFLNFNGTAGVWRRRCMDDAGGWEGDTLTEDLDLSYRAQLRGWRIHYRPDVVAPAELPVQIDAFKRQQFRWAKGSLQTAIKLFGKLWTSHNPFWRKALGTLHLTNYLVHPLMVLNLLLIWPMTFSESFVLRLAPFFTVAAIGPPLMYWAAMSAQDVPWPARLRQLALLLALGTGLSANNTRAAIEAIFRIRSAFKRTPKFAVTDKQRHWQTSSYALPKDPTAWVELALAVYATVLLVYSLSIGMWWVVLWLILYSFSYSYIASLAFVQAWQCNAARSAIPGLGTLE
jgi:cellulose synthase/poly-beta-1,6-N-acetylglucosamine synthase-like glycosyltransferase